MRHAGKPGGNRSGDLSDVPDSHVWPGCDAAEPRLVSHLLMCTEDSPERVWVLLSLFALRRSPGSTGHHSEAVF